MRVGESIKIFRRIWLYHSAENFRRGDSFGVSFIYGIEKVSIREEVGYQDFLSKFFCLTVPENFVMEPLYDVFHKKYGSEKDYE